jgi:hypothetical protein
MVFTMSATAPQFLPEQEKQERATLSQEEIAEIEEDIYYNWIVKFEETPEMKETGVQELQKALDAIAPFEKRALIEACEKVPDLVQRESDPAAFLRSERYNPEVNMLLGRSTRIPRIESNPHSDTPLTIFSGRCDSSRGVLEAAQGHIWCHQGLRTYDHERCPFGRLGKVRKGPRDDLAHESCRASSLVFQWGALGDPSSQHCGT